MKPKKLVLNKETVSNLLNAEMSNIRGGEWTDLTECGKSECIPCWTDGQFTCRPCVP